MNIEYALSDEDLEFIKNVFEKKLALEALIKSEGISANLMKDLISTYSQINAEYTNWWSKKIKELNLENSNYELQVDFENKRIVNI
ncbi:hypothetical protein [Dubosiella newyorkensis]|jgi:CXXX repeat modification system protein|uniref:CXXX repeat peptide modification system protein n=1 Tax=Dubosiella newyorkensis TaxID=1862672 RepID=A0A1U7NLS5_9FIRM|nr:hypothetical protein [Dubosiella newyorkensis]OLU45761.1 hypothetical protein BO225_07840 [Dubosiella newyorkensis]